MLSLALLLLTGEPVSVRINGEESIREVIPSMGVLRGLVADMLDGESHAGFDSCYVIPV